MSKIPKFGSRIRKPQDILTELPTFRNGNNRLRRSTSLETLNVEDRKICFSTFTAGSESVHKTKSQNNIQKLRVQTKSTLLSNQTEDQVQDLPVINKRPGRVNLRRSRSVSDLKATSEVRDFLKPKAIKPGPSNLKVVPNKVTKVVNRAKPTPTVKPNIPPKTAVKRQGENCDTEVKKKILKKTKVPDWDYKTRFNILREEYNELKHDASMAEVMKSEYQGKIAMLCESEENLRKQMDKFQIMYDESCKYAKNLENKYDENKKELEEWKQKYCELSNRYDQCFSEKSCLSDEVQKLLLEKKELEELKENYKQLSNKYDQCSSEKSHLSDQVKHLLVELYNGEQIRKKLHNTIQDLKGNIRVFCRLRPALTDDETINLCSFNFPDINSIEIMKRRAIDSSSAIKNSECQEFTFDRVFDSDATQEEVFEELSQLVQSAMDGYHVCVFAYGQTGSGKTYTMQGKTHPREALGMIPRSVELLFNRKAEMEERGWGYKIEASFLEIYNENIRDLLDLKSGKSLDIRYNEGRGTSVPNLTVVSISTAEELIQYMYKSQQNRSTAVTNYNEHSSRSHAVTKIYIESRYQDSKEIFMGSVSLVDLAGSESARSVSNERLAETKNINRSLSNLGNVLMALHKKDTHVPYRNSKLTFLLQSSLGGNCKCLMIVNISPVIDSFNESVNALRFAAKVKEVKIASTKNKLVTPNK